MPYSIRQVGEGLVRWGDYDADGDLDLVQSGRAVGSPLYDRLPKHRRERIRTPPGRPGNLTSTIVGDKVRLSWSAATDAQTAPDWLDLQPPRRDQPRRLRDHVGDGAERRPPAPPGARQRAGADFVARGCAGRSILLDRAGDRRGLCRLHLPDGTDDPPCGRGRRDRRAGGPPRAGHPESFRAERFASPWT